MGCSWDPVWQKLHGGKNVVVTQVFPAPKGSSPLGLTTPYVWLGVSEQVATTDWPSCWADHAWRSVGCCSSWCKLSLAFSLHVFDLTLVWLVTFDLAYKGCIWTLNLYCLVGCDLWEQHMANGFLHPKREVHAVGWRSKGWLWYRNNPIETAHPKPLWHNWGLLWKCKLHNNNKKLF